MNRQTFFGIAVVFILSSSFLILFGIELSVAENQDFVLLEGTNVDLYMPENSSGLNVIEVLADFEAAKVCDLGYELLNHTVGAVPFSGEKITITAEGYDGDENFPGYAGHAGNPIVIVYDRLSQKNYILSYTPEGGSNSLPNFGLYFHEMYHNFQPSEFGNLLPRYHYTEGFARFMANFITTIVINEAQNLGLNQSCVEKMYSNKEWSIDLERGLDPQTANFSASGHIFVSAVLHEIANDYGDYGKSVFASFFKLMEESHHLFNVQTNVEINSLFLALINTAAYSDYRLVYEYYTFETDPALYESYRETLRSFLPSLPPERVRCVTYEDDTYVVGTRSNSLVSNLRLNQTEKSLSFTVEGTAETTGSCNITIPSELLSGDFTVFMDGLQLVESADYSSSFNGTHHTLNINYEHSTHTIRIVGTSVIPDFDGWLFLPFSIYATILVLAINTRLRKQQKHV